MFILLSDFISFSFLPKKKLEYKKHRTVPGVLSWSYVGVAAFSVQNYWKSTEVKSFDVSGVPPDKLQVWQAIRAG